MFNFDYITKEDITEHNLNWPEIPDHPYRTLIVGSSGSEKTNVLFNLINNESDIEKIYLYAKDPHEAKSQLLNYQKREYRFEVLKWFKSFYWILTWYGWYLSYIEKYNLKRNGKYWLYLMIWLLICLAIKNLIHYWFIRGRKINICLVFITQSYLAVLKNITTTLNALFCYENLKQNRTSTNCI